MNSNVYSCILDASKAFDRVNHYVLFDKLVKRGVPLYIVRILVFWYNVQKMYDGIIRCLTVFISLHGLPKTYCLGMNLPFFDSFSVSNGVRQGGIHSPYLFCVYMDALSKKLNNVNAGSSWVQN